MPSRKEIAAQIAAHPDDYKICEGCSSIVVQNAQLCPNCHAYRFNHSHEAIIKQAEILGAREQTSVTSEDLS